jgi:hypothetical protein
MADVKISALNALGTSPAADDLIPVVDVTATETKKLRIDELFTNPDVTGTLTTDGVFSSEYLTVSGGKGLQSINTININADYDASGAGGINLKTKDILRIQIENDGNIAFCEDTGTTAKFYWDASAESLGLGTSSPATALEVKGDGAAIQVSSVDYDVALLGRRGSSGVDIDKGYMRLRDTGTTKVAIDSAGDSYFNGGNVGIGTTSPVNNGANYGDLTINGTTGAFISLQSGGSTTGVLQTISTETRLSTATSGGFLAFRTDTGGVGTEAMRLDSSGAVIVNNGGSSNGLVKINGATGSTEAVIFQRGGTEASRIGHTNSADLTFSTGSSVSERVRIDSSGNLLVGKSSADNTTAGVRILGPLGFASFVRDAGEAIIVNRLTDDGDLIEFRKDASTVGTIGSSNSGTDLVIDATRFSNRAGLRFRDSSLYPRQNATDADGLVDLGGSAARFKDLYLSGGVYLGGTTSANLLDDYEEGTWTVTDASGASLSITGSAGTYTKVGRMVTCSINFTMPSTADATACLFGGLPFTSANDNDLRGSIAIGFSSASVNLSGGLTAINATSFTLREDDNETAPTNADLSSANIYLTITYFTA